jgi:8-oxo-dGTP diphosphatase
MITVTAAVIAQDGRFLICKRPRGKNHGGLWEFPGGKIEPGETAEEALAREIREELDTEIAVEAPFDRVEYDYPDFHLSMQCFLCRVIRGSLVLKEHEDAAWLDRDRLDDVRWLPADETVISRLRELLPAGNRSAPDAAE